MPNVLIVDDSPTARAALRAALESPSSPLRVVAEARTGAECLAMLRKHKPDIVTLDVCLGREDGCEVAQSVMRSHPVPIVLVTGVNPKDPALAFRALRAGVLEVLPKPAGPRSASYAADCRHLVRSLVALSKVPVVRQRAPRVGRAIQPAAPWNIDLVLVGASTGGPPLLQELLGCVPPLPVPMVVVQHITEGFGAGLVTWLGETTKHRTVTCTRPSRLEGGVVLFAPDGSHVVLADRETLVPVDRPPRHFHRPSVDELFESAASYRASSTLAVLLTGMGSDGAAGLAALRQRGALTVAQAPETCTIDGMPESAIRMGAARWVLTPAEIASLLRSVGSKRLSHPANRGDDP